MWELIFEVQKKIEITNPVDGKNETFQFSSLRNLLEKRKFREPILNIFPFLNHSVVMK